jgi:hypothetical protein
VLGCAQASDPSTRDILVRRLLAYRREWKKESRERPKEIDPMIWRTFLTTFLKVDKDEGGSIELCGATAQTLD